jgi:hypothetical protein
MTDVMWSLRRNRERPAPDLPEPIDNAVKGLRSAAEDLKVAAQYLNDNYLSRELPLPLPPPPDGTET